MKAIVKITISRGRFLVTIPKYIADKVELEKYDRMVIKADGKGRLRMWGDPDNDKK